MSTRPYKARQASPVLPATPPAQPAPAKRPLRVVIASHSHPELTSGGAEIAAFELYKRLSERDDFEVWFIGCDRSPAGGRSGVAFSQPFSEREYIYHAGEFDWFKFANRDSRFPEELAELLEKIQPDVMHFHHYMNFGVETIAHVRRVLPDCRIYMTLHEFLAICHHYGQMVTTKNYGLCYRSSPGRCSRCFPDLTPADFFLRRTYIQEFLGMVDGFISPSHFLAERYIAWGLPRDKLSVVENVLPNGPRTNAPRRGRSRDVLRVGFFGQISLLKGINVTLDAAEMLSQQGITNVAFEVFGDYRAQPEEFKKQFLARLSNLPSNTHLHGPYERERVGHLMQTVDVVLVPSIWWENSPLVIQEALRAGRPAVCSDIGGMAEKVTDGVDGFLFPAGSAVDLASLLRRLADDPDQLKSVEAGVAARKTDDAAMEEHLRLYRAAPMPPTEGAAASKCDTGTKR